MRFCVAFLRHRCLALLLTSLSVCVLVSISVHAQDGLSGLHIVSGRGTQLDTAPGELLTLPFMVTNETDQEQSLADHLELPTGWRLIIGGGLFSLAPREADLRLLSVSIPATTPAATYRLVYTVTSPQEPGVSPQQDIEIRVLPQTQLTVTLQDAPPYVLAGESYDIVFEIANRSNTTNAVNLEIQSSESYPANVDTTSLQLDMGETKRIRVTVATNSEVNQELAHVLRLTLKSRTLEDVQATATSRVDIIPRTGRNADRFHRLPATLEGRWFADEAGMAFQLEAVGSGVLSEEGSPMVDFLFRGPDVENRDVLSQSSLYRLNLITDAWELALGHHHYSLSPLTEQYFYGQGAMGSFQSGRYHVQGFHAKSLWHFQEHQTGMKIGYQVLDPWQIDLHFLDRAHEEFPSDQVWSIQTRARPLSPLGLEAEYGSGMEHRQAAWRVRAEGQHRWTRYHAEVIHADPEYPGRYRGVDYRTADAVFGLPGRLSLYLNYSKSDRNHLPVADTEDRIQQKSYGTMLRWRFSAHYQAMLDYRRFSRRETLLPSEFHSDYHLIRLGWGHTLRRVNLHTSFEWTRPEPSSLEHPSFSVRSSAHYIPNSQIQISGHIQWISPRIEGRSGTQVILGGRMWYRPAEQTQFRLDLQTARLGESYVKTRLDAESSYQWKHEHQISLKGLYTSQRSNHTSHRQISGMLAYRVLFSIPVSRKSSIGVLRGHVVDRFSRGQPGLAGVLLHVGEHTSLSDTEGYFEFPALQPGRAYLTVDTASVGMDWVVLQPMPLAVTIEGGEATEVRLDMSRAANLRGRLVLFTWSGAADRLAGNQHVSEPENPPAVTFAEQDGLPNILLELRGSSGTHRRLTDGQGRFEFQQIPPGAWTLSVHDANLPPNHVLEQSTFQLVLTPGDEQELLIRVLPEQRQIDIIDEGELELEP